MKIKVKGFLILFYCRPPQLTLITVLLVHLVTNLLTLAREAEVQIPTRIPEKIVVALFSGILVNSGILVVAGRLPGLFLAE